MNSVYHKLEALNISKWMVLGLIIIQIVPVVVLAAPPVLPGCGHNGITGVPSLTSGPPDIAHNNSYTAVVWSEGANASSMGVIKLAFAEADISKRGWIYSTIDSGSTNLNPAVAFDKNITNTVHIAYQQSSGAIKYKRCALGGTCDSGETKTFTPATTNFSYSNPQIAVNSANKPVIVFQESGAGGTLWINYASITGGVATVVRDAFFNHTDGADGILQSNPTIAANDLVHIAYQGDDARIYYARLNAAITVTTKANFVPGSGVTKPDYPAIAVSGAKVRLVWDLQKSGDVTTFYPVYNESDDNGATWFAGIIYRVIPSNNASTVAPNASLDERTSGTSGDFSARLRPDVFIGESGGISITHVAWQEYRIGNGSGTNRHDISYSYYNGTKWQGTLNLNGDDAGSPISYTNVTTIYGESSYAENSVKFDHNNNRPSLLFREKITNATRNRLEIVYTTAVTNVSTGRDVYYNGWELGSSMTTPITPTSRTEQDTDCDSIPDSVEIPSTPPVGGCTPDPVGITLYPDDYSFGYYNCNGTAGEGISNYDKVPDFMDTNSDGDFRDDFTEYNSNNPNDWRSYSSDGGVFLPVILKSA